MMILYFFYTERLFVIRQIYYQCVQNLILATNGQQETENHKPKLLNYAYIIQFNFGSKNWKLKREKIEHQ